MFVLTADQPNTLDLTKKDRNKSYNKLYPHNVPLIFHYPGKNLESYQNNQFSSHTDIIPSVMNYLSIPHQSSVTANSIFPYGSKKKIFYQKRNDILSDERQQAFNNLHLS